MKGRLLVVSLIVVSIMLLFIPLSMFAQESSDVPEYWGNASIGCFFMDIKEELFRGKIKADLLDVLPKTSILEGVVKTGPKAIK